jgi:hypothetical protein
MTFPRRAGTRTPGRADVTDGQVRNHSGGQAAVLSETHPKMPVIYAGRQVPGTPGTMDFMPWRLCRLT